MKELLNYISDPKNSQYNFVLGRWYEEQGHTAAAAGFYVRTTEFSLDNKLTYEALLRIGICLLKQGSRVYMAKGVFLRAISLLPTRPEAYFLLSELYEHSKDWQESYTFACLGLALFEHEDKVSPLLSNVGYPGMYGFLFEKAVSAWWCGLIDESLHLFRQLNKRVDLLPIHAESVKSNLKNLSNNLKPL